jgi:NAD-dependent dihydropyrimidine dehydrogenase PreA subunit
MWVITVDSNKCQGDGDCVDICPSSILSLAETGGKKVAVVQGSADDCLGCMSCTTTCTNDAITVVDA